MILWQEKNLQVFSTSQVNFIQKETNLLKDKSLIDKNGLRSEQNNSYYAYSNMEDQKQPTDPLFLGNITKKEEHFQKTNKTYKAQNSFEAELNQEQYNPFLSNTSRLDRSIFDDNDISAIHGVKDFLDSAQPSPVKQEPKTQSQPVQPKPTKAQEIAAKKAAQKQNKPSAMSDILKEASMIKDQWKETLGSGGVSVQEKSEENNTEPEKVDVNPAAPVLQEVEVKQDLSQTETKDSEFIEQSGVVQDNNINKEVSTVIKSQADFTKKPQREVKPDEEKPETHQGVHIDSLPKEEDHQVNQDQDQSSSQDKRESPAERDDNHIEGNPVQPEQAREIEAKEDDQLHSADQLAPVSPSSDDKPQEDKH